MASSITLKSTVGMTQQYIYNAPLLFTQSAYLAYSIGDHVRQFMLGPPFVWRWNRSFVPPQVLIPGQTDYSINIPDFGFIERATIITPPGTGNTVQKSYELTVEQTLVGETVLGQPAFISVIGDDNNGNITFRLMGVPDAAYTLNIVYQKAAPNFSSLNDTWAPIPDYYSYIYNLGFLAKAYEFKGDERFAFAHQEFMKMVVSASDGLTDTQKNIFLDQRLAYNRELQGDAQKGQIGRSVRSGL